MSKCSIGGKREREREGERERGADIWDESHERTRRIIFMIFLLNNAAQLFEDEG